MWSHFFPDEPVGRSLEMTSPSWLINQTYIMDSIRKGACIAAINEAGEILAVRLGVVRNRNDNFERIFETVATYLLIFPFLCSLLPKSLKKTWIFIKLQKKIDFDVWTMFDQLGCDRIYEDKAVCSARGHGIRGLGTEICRRSERLARDLGCSHTYAAVTGLYSQRIFTKLEHTTLTSLRYDDFRDENGELYLRDTREHEKIITCVKKLI